MKKVLIVGAGLAGTTAANFLSKAGLKVQVVEKSRGAGGRMATKRMKNTRADHGAQYFSAKSNVFQKQVKVWQSKDLVQTWKRNEDDSYDRFYAKNGMSSLPKELLGEIELLTGHRVIRWEYDASGFNVYTEEGNVFKTDAIICTAPAPQSIDILLKSEDDKLCLTALSQIQYDPCLALLIATKTAINLGKSGAQYPNHSSYNWLMSNHCKGFASEPTYTLHTSHEFAVKHVDGDTDDLKTKMLQDLPDILKVAEIEESILHKWRYSIASKRLSEKFIKTDTGVYFGGDGFGMGNVEGAYLSGLAIAQDLLQNI